MILSIIGPAPYISATEVEEHDDLDSSQKSLENKPTSSNEEPLELVSPAIKRPISFTIS